jgi:hypothetical protein
MKASMPKGPGLAGGPTATGLDGAGAVSGADLEGISGTGEAGGVQEAARTEASSAAGRAGALDETVARIGSLLRSGQIDGPRAAELLASEVIARKQSALPPGAAERLREALLRLLSDDPTLARAVKGLENE